MELVHKIVSNETEFESFRKSVMCAGLPHQDLNYQNQVLIIYTSGDGEIVGTGGLEIQDPFALMRSVSVVKDHRNKQIGKHITSDLVDNVKRSNLKALYLMTETATSFFQKLGFETVDRERVPSEIKSTSEFSHVCPVSAACMVLKFA
jgi:amino-acid N-acetyltransferase